MIEPMEKMPPEECAICHRWAESCICPECPKCGAKGDPNCFGFHFPLPNPRKAEPSPSSVAHGEAMDWERVLWDAAKVAGFDKRMSLHYLHTFSKAIRAALAEAGGPHA